MRNMRFRPSVKQSVRANLRSLKALGPVAPELLASAERYNLDKPQGTRQRKAYDDAQLEAPVLRAVGELLAQHPLVLFAVRQNAGMAWSDRVGGRPAPIKFYQIVTGQPVVITDYWGFLTDKRPFAIECKRPVWSEPRTEREKKQALFIALIRNLGGVGGFVRSVDEAQALLLG